MAHAPCVHCGSPWCTCYDTDEEYDMAANTTSKPTPAEALAARKEPRRPPGSKPLPQKRVWRCRVREVRLALRLSIRDVAPAVGLSVTGLWQIEHGTDPQLTTARRLAAFFGKAVEELWPELAGGGP